MKRVRQPENWSLLLALAFSVLLCGFFYHVYRTNGVSLDRWIFYHWYDQPENLSWLVVAGMNLLLIMLLGRALLLRKARWRWVPPLLVVAAMFVLVFLFLSTPIVSGMAQLTSVNLDNHVYGIFYQPPPAGSAFCGYVMVECEADGSQCRPVYDSKTMSKNQGFIVPLVFCDTTFSSAADPAHFRLVTDDHRVIMQVDNTPVFTYPPAP